MYHSPLREDKDASFKVDFQKNLWIDFGLAEGGTMIDLVMKLKNCSLHDAMNELTHGFMNSQYQPSSFSFHGKENTPSITIIKVLPLRNQALLDYLTERNINLDIAKGHCHEIYYAVGDKRYFALGFKNDADGYELRNKYFKGCTGKDISTAINTENKNEVCLVFEGFTDYLSYLTMKDIQKSKVNVVVLNSVANLSKALDFIKSHPKVYTYLDNDESGRKATQIINNVSKSHIDKSTEYAKYKDLNEYLCDRKLAEKEEQERKPSRGFKM